MAMKAAKTWDYEFKQRVNVGKGGPTITRVRPAFYPGWVLEVRLGILRPDLISPDLLLDVVSLAGRFIGVGLFRPTYGRFEVKSFKTQRGV